MKKMIFVAEAPPTDSEQMVTCADVIAERTNKRYYRGRPTRYHVQRVPDRLCEAVNQGLVT